MVKPIWWIVALLEAFGGDSDRAIENYRRLRQADMTTAEGRRTTERILNWFEEHAPDEVNPRIKRTLEIRGMQLRFYRRQVAEDTPVDPWIQRAQREQEQRGTQAATRRQPGQAMQPEAQQQRAELDYPDWGLDPRRGVRDPDTPVWIPPESEIGGPQYDDEGFLLPPDMSNWSDDEIVLWVEEHMGYMAWVMDEPELREMFIEAMRDRWPEERIHSAIQNSEWFRNTEPTRRAWAQMQSEDPAGAQQMLENTKLEIQMRANQMGVRISDERLTQMANDFIANGWVGSAGQPASPMFDRSIIHEGQYRPQEMGGDIAATTAGVKQMAHQYMVPISDDAAHDWAVKLISGDATDEGVRAFFLQQAKQRFPHLSEQIDAGVTPRQYFDPYMSEASRLLEKPPGSIDLMNDPRFSTALDPVDGRPMLLSEWQQHVRRLPAWQRTRQANQQAAEIAEGIGQMFGQAP